MKIMDKVLEMETKKIVSLLLWMIILSWITFALLGFIIGYMTSQRDLYDYLGWWKTVTDCEKCNNWKCATMLKGYEPFLNESQQPLLNISMGYYECSS